MKPDQAWGKRGDIGPERADRLGRVDPKGNGAASGTASSIATVTPRTNTRPSFCLLPVRLLRFSSSRPAPQFSRHAVHDVMMLSESQYAAAADPILHTSLDRDPRRFAGLRGGPGRIRTCNQKVISGKFGETIA